MYLLFQNGDVAILDSSPPQFNPDTAEAVATAMYESGGFVQDKNVTSQSDTSKASSDGLKGVAVTLFLHSPTWFQRRYTMTIQNINNNLPEGWKVQIFYTAKGQSQNGIDINRGLQRMIQNGEVILTTIPEEIHLKKRKMFEIITEPWLWRNMLAKKVLMFGGNSVVCSNSKLSLETFLHWDYLGSPWDSFKGVGGTSGISLRNRDAMLQVINYELSKISDPSEKAKAYLNWKPEDNFFVSRMLEMNEKGITNFKIAPRNVTLEFAAIGSSAHSDVWAVSGTLPVLKFKDRDQFLIRCPELKLLFPSLHDPSCFGAKPDGAKCETTICALQIPRRKGGC
jgi:hypothetical protein